MAQVYDLFTDNSRVHEYNEYCKDVVDLEWLDEHTKITHSRTGRPFSRDFVTRVHYRRLDADTQLVVNRAEQHPRAQLEKGYTRMDMPLGANMMRRLPDDPSKTEFTLITHVNPVRLSPFSLACLTLDASRPFRRSLGKRHQAAERVPWLPLLLYSMAAGCWPPRVPHLSRGPCEQGSPLVSPLPPAPCSLPRGVRASANACDEGGGSRTAVCKVWMSGGWWRWQAREQESDASEWEVARREAWPTLTLGPS